MNPAKIIFEINSVKQHNKIVFLKDIWTFIQFTEMDIIPNVNKHNCNRVFFDRVEAVLKIQPVCLSEIMSRDEVQISKKRYCEFL